MGLEIGQIWHRDGSVEQHDPDTCQQPHGAQEEQRDVNDYHRKSQQVGLPLKAADDHLNLRQFQRRFRHGHAEQQALLPPGRIAGNAIQDAKDRQIDHKQHDFIGTRHVN